MPTGNNVISWRVQDALMLRSTCRSLRIHPPTPKYISMLLTLLSGKIHTPISDSESFYYRRIFHLFQTACILHSRRKLIHFLPYIVKFACAKTRSNARLYDCPPNGCYVDNRRQFEEWLEAKYKGCDTVTIAGSFALKRAEVELGIKGAEESRSWQPNDIDVFIHGADEGEEHAVCDSVFAFCSQMQKECFLVLNSHSKLEVHIRHDPSYDSYPVHHYHSVPYEYEDKDAMRSTLKLSPDEIVRSKIQYSKCVAKSNPSVLGDSYLSSHLKRRNRGRVFESTEVVLNQLEDNGWLDANTEVGLPRRYTIHKAIAIDAFKSPFEMASSNFFTNLKLPSINIIQFQGAPRSSLDIVSGFDILPCQVWLTSDDESASGFKVNYADDRVKHCIQNQKLELSKYAFNPCYNYDIPASLFIKENEINENWYGPIPKQVSRIIKYKTRGYTL